MAEKRKLLAEIEKCFKKIDEGVEEFEGIMNKMQDANSDNQRDKYQDDLKKEIKKLQRLRDQVKGWQNSSDIKDKDKLTQYRKIIEHRMEQFKDIERENKTKPHSKQGLCAEEKLDPKEKEKCETTEWLQSQISELELEVDRTELQMEALSITDSGKKGRKGKDDPKKGDKEKKADDLKKHHEKMKNHISQLELCMRLVNNETLESAAVMETLKEGVEMFVASLDPDYDDEHGPSDTLDPEDLYEELDLSSYTTTLGGVVHLSSVDQEHHDNGTHPNENGHSTVPAPLHDLESVTKSRHGSADTPASPAPRRTAATSIQSTPLKLSSQLSSDNSSFLSQPTPATPPPLAPCTPGIIPYNSVVTGVKNLPPPVVSAPTTPPVAVPVAAAATPTSVVAAASAAIPTTPVAAPVAAPSLTQPSTPIAQTPVKPAPTSVTKPAGSPSQHIITTTSTSTSHPHTVTTNDENRSPLVSNSTSTTTTFTSAAVTGPSAIGNSSFSVPTAAAQHITATATQLGKENEVPSSTVSAGDGVCVSTPTDGGQQGEETAYAHHSTTGVSHSASHQDLAFTNAPQMQEADTLKTMSAETVPVSAEISKSLDPIGTPTRRHTTINDVSMAEMTLQDDVRHVLRLSNTNNDLLKNTPQSARIPPWLGASPLGRTPHLPDHEAQLMALDQTLGRCPPQMDSERPRSYLPKMPCTTASYYPQSPPPNADTLEYYLRLSPETLFFTFYYMEGSRAQLLAAKALKKLSWRFHTKYLMWFQRHEEPKQITDDFEQGTYIYFDYEKWSQRKKEQFVFEYRYLEDKEFD